MTKSKVNFFYIIKNTVLFIFLTMLFVLVFQSIKLRTDKDYIPTVFGHTYLNVLSESMTPEFESKDLIFGKLVKDTKTLKVGDIITYRDENILVTHRIESIEEGHKTFITKGDANETSDIKKVMPQQIVSKYKNKIPKAGTILAKFQDFKFLGLVWIISMYFILSELYKEFKILKNNKKEKLLEQENC